MLQLAFQACLEDLEPPIGPRDTFDDAIAQVRNSGQDVAAFRDLPESNMEAVFQDVQLAAASRMEAAPAAVADAAAAVRAVPEGPALAQEAAAAAAVDAGRADTARAAPQADQSELDALKEEQVCSPTL